MNDTARSYQQPDPSLDPATTSGMDELFENIQDQIQEGARLVLEQIQDLEVDQVHDRSSACLNQIQEEKVELISLARAAEISGKARRYLLSLVHKGKLKGVKDSDGSWLVRLDQVQARSRVDMDQIQDLEVEQVQDEFSSDVEQIHAQQESINGLVLFRELQAATYRNGYLESQIAVYSEQVKLLPDLQSKANEAEEYRKQMQLKEQEIESLKNQVAELQLSWWQRLKRNLR